MGSTVKRFASNALFLYSNQILLTIGSFLVALKVIDYLGPVQYGIYSTVLAFASFFGMLTISTGIDDLVISDLSAEDTRTSSMESYLATAFYLRIGLGAAAFLLVILTSALVGYENPVRGLILLYSVGMLFAFHTRNSLLATDYIVSEQRLVPELVVFTVTSAVLLGKYIFTVVRAPLAWFVGADVALAAGISLTFLLVSVARRKITLSPRYFNPDVARTLLRRALPISISALLVSIFLRVDQVMLSRMLGMKEVGLYSVAVRLVEAANFVPVLAASLLLPVYSRFRESTRRDDLLRLSFRAASWTSLLLVAGFSLFGRDLLILLWEDRFLGSLIPLQILSWSALFVFMGTLNGAMSVAFDLQKYNLAFIAIQSVLNVILNWTLIPVYGPAGAAASTTFTYGLGFVIMFAFPAMRFIAKQAWREALPLTAAVGILLFGARGEPLMGRWWAAAVLIPATLLLARSSLRLVKDIQMDGAG